MIENKMYSDRVKNIPVMRYCGFNCIYCAFQKFQKISKCQDCRENNIHSHLEVLQRTPPKTKEGQFLTIGLSGDVSFMTPNEFCVVLDYCEKWDDRTFLIQSKNPSYFLKFPSISDTESSNIIFGTTIESDYWMWDDLDYSSISKAPFPMKRLEAMVRLDCRKAITIEPIIYFSDRFYGHLLKASPEFIYVGYANDKHNGKKLKLPEPPLEKTMQLINELQRAGIEVKEKTLRKAWWE